MRAALCGAGVALAMGLMLGGAMRPTLAGDDRPAGPQIILGESAQRSTGPFDPGPTFTGYQGRIPDYVLGTDSTQPVAVRTAPEPAAAHAPIGQAVDDADEAPDDAD